MLFLLEIVLTTLSHHKINYLWQLRGFTPGIAEYWAALSQKFSKIEFIVLDLLMHSIRSMVYFVGHV